MPFDIRDFCRNCIPRACTPYISVAAMGTVINLTLQLCRAQTAAILARFSLTERNDKFVTVKIKRERERTFIFFRLPPLHTSFVFLFPLVKPFFPFLSFFLFFFSINSTRRNPSSSFHHVLSVVIRRQDEGRKKGNLLSVNYAG